MKKMLTELRIFSLENRRPGILQQLYKCNKSLKIGLELRLKLRHIETDYGILCCLQKQSSRYMYVYIQISVNIIAHCKMKLP